MSLWTSIRDTVESAASLVGNYYYPGSGLITERLVSKGSQKQLGSTAGQIAMVGTGVAGGAAGNLANYGTLVNQVLGQVSPQTAQLVGDAGTSTSSGAGAVAKGAQDAAGETGAAASAAQEAGVSSNPSEFLNAKTPDPITGITGTANASGVSPYNAVTPSSSDVTAAAPSGSSMIDRTLNWVKDNPRVSAALGLGGMQIIGGALQGAGARAGKLEEIKAQEEANAQLLRDRQAIAGTGGYYGTPGVSAPANTRVLRRPDGSLVYLPNNGLIAGQMA